MSDQVLTVLISSSTGLIGALIGFAASFFSSKRTLDQAKEQRRIERTQEIQAEIVPQLIATIQRFPAVRERDLTELVDRHYGRLLELIRNHPAYNRGSFTQEELEECLHSDLMRSASIDTHRHQNEWLGEFEQWTNLHLVWLPRELLPLVSEFGSVVARAARAPEGHSEDRALQEFQQKAGSRTTYKTKEVEELLVKMKAATFSDLTMRAVNIGELQDKTNDIWATARKALRVDQT